MAYPEFSYKVELSFNRIILLVSTYDAVIEDGGYYFLIGRDDDLDSYLDALSDFLGYTDRKIGKVAKRKIKKLQSKLKDGEVLIIN